MVKSKLGHSYNTGANTPRIAAAKRGQIYSSGPAARLAFSLEILYITRMGKTNSNQRNANADTKDSKAYEKHVCGECAKCTPETAFHTLTVKDRKPTMGRCPEEKYCVLLSQRACREFIAEAKPPGSA